MKGAADSTAAVAERPGDWARRRRLGQPLGRYVLGSLLGSGGAASVYMARLDGPQGFERVVAVKLVHEHLLTDGAFSAAFLDEANLACRLQHPGIAHCYDLCQDGQQLYLVMEYLQGQPLSRLYQRARERRQPLPYGLVAWIGARAAEALGYAHDCRDDAGQSLDIVHRDVSPDNLFVTYDGQVKLLDFGIAKAAGRRAQTSLGQLKGKFRYMAPEYALGLEFDAAVDIFALGATLYEAATGVPTFAGDEQVSLRRIIAGDVTDPRQLRPDFPESLWGVLALMLATEPGTRPRPAAKLARLLESEAGLSQAQGKALLSSTILRLFPDEMAAEAGDIAELRKLTRGPDEGTVQGQVVGPARQERSPWRSAGAWGVGVGALVASLAALSTRAPTNEGEHAALNLPSAPPPPARPSATVEVAVRVNPTKVANLAIEIDGVVTPSEAPARSVPKGERALPVSVRAPGYRPVNLSVVPDRDQSLFVELSPVPTPTPTPRTSSSARALAPAPVHPPTGVIRRAPY